MRVPVVDLGDDREHRHLEQDRVQPRPADRDVDLAVRSGDALDVDEPLVELEESEQVDEIALEEAPAAQVRELVRREAQRAEAADLVANLGDVRRQVDVRIAALETVLDLRSRKVMQDDLHHRELVEVGVEQRRDDHAGAAGATRRCGRHAMDWESANVTRLGEPRPTGVDRRPVTVSSRRWPRDAAVVDDPDPAHEPQARNRAARRKPSHGAVVRERAVRRAPDDETRDQRRDSRGELLDRRVEAHEAAAQSRLDAAGDERHRGAEAPGHEHEEQHRQRHDPAQRQRRQVRGDQDGHDRDHREDREQPPLAVPVGEPADHLRGDERRRAAGEVDDGDLRLGDADVGDVVGGDERNHGEHRPNQHDHERERAPVIRHAEDRPQLRERMAMRARRDVRRERRNDARRRDPDGDAQRREREKRRAPREVRGDPQRQRHAGDRGQRKGGGDDRGRRRAARVGNEIGDDREDEPAEHAAERAGDDARRKQQRIVRRDAAERGRDDEARVESRAAHACGRSGRSRTPRRSRSPRPRTCTPTP